MPFESDDRFGINDGILILPIFFVGSLITRVHRIVEVRFSHLYLMVACDGVPCVKHCDFFYFGCLGDEQGGLLERLIGSELTLAKVELFQLGEAL